MNKEMVFCRKFIALVFLTFLVFPSSASKKKKSFTLIIPGIEQIKSGRYVKGILLAGGFVSFTAGALIKNKDGYRYYDKYRAATTPDSAVFYRKKTEENFKERNFFILGAVGVWVIHMFDLKFSGKKKAAIGGGIEKGNFYLGFRFSF